MSITMKRMFLAAVIVVILLMAFSETLYAGYVTEIYNIFYYDSESVDLLDYRTESFGFVGSFTAEQKSEVLFENLINNPEQGKIPLIPEGTSLIDVEIIDGTLILNVTRQIKDYGGNMYEKALIRQFALTAYGIEGVHRLTILIEYNSDVLTEGTLIYERDLGELLNEDVDWAQ